MVEVNEVDYGFRGMDGREFTDASGDDRIAGSSKADLIFALEGNNIVKAGAGDDVVFGGSGNDNVEAGTGNDIVYGGAGNDVLGGGEGNDILIGGAGDDTLSGGVGDDVLSGGSGSDTFNFGAGFGNDIITDFTFGTGGDKLNLQAGAAGNTKNISVRTLDDFNALVASNIVDHSQTGVTQHGAYKLVFLTGDSITFLNFEAQTSGSPNSAGTGGNDTLYTGLLDGQITGGAGDDIALAGAGKANINGGDGNDTLVGGSGSDLIGGGAGDDILFGNAGDDVLSGGLGNDILTGGEGKDNFIFGGNFGHDIVTDLDFVEGDALTFTIGGKNIKIASDSELAAFAATHGGTTVDGGANLMLDIDGTGANTVKLIGHGGVVSV